MTENVSKRPAVGLPGLRGTDHFGFTVPDMEEAHRFFVDIIGCDFVYRLGKKEGAELMSQRMGVHPEATVEEIRFFRCATGANFEVFTYTSPDQVDQQPKNSDIGGHHIAFYVDDLDASVAYLRDAGVEVMGEPTASAEASTGQRWVYFRAPWGMQFELVSFPQGKAYEKDASVVLWDPRRPSA